jgi:hypothetical protein
LELAQGRDGLEHALVVARGADVTRAFFAGRRGSVRLVRLGEAIRGSLGAQRSGVVPLRAGRDARRDELDVVDVHDVEVRRAQAAERAPHAAADGGARVVEVCAAGAVAPDFGQELVGAAREFAREGLEGFAEDEL